MMFDYIDILKQIVLKQVPTDAFAIFLFGSQAVRNAKHRFIKTSRRTCRPLNGY
jgi:hypothetical protein